MLIHLITPARPGSLSGNRVTAARWARLLGDLGHRVVVRQQYNGRICDLLIALHARKSFASIRRYHRARPGAPFVVALGGTDLYRDLRTSASARTALEWAQRILVLQPLATAALPAHLRRKTRPILQSALPPRRAERSPRGEFRVCVLSHLRPVKDPMRGAIASRLLPSSSRIRVVHLGRALSSRIEARVRDEMARNPRYRWIGGTSHARALRVLAGSRLLVLPSRLEGGANVVSEALACRVPVLASRIPGSAGILGARYPGLFPAGDTRSLARLLARCETDPRFYASLKAWCRRLSPLVRPARERAAWAALLDELTGLRPSSLRSGGPAARTAR